MGHSPKTTRLDRTEPLGIPTSRVGSDSMPPRLRVVIVAVMAAVALAPASARAQHGEAPPSYRLVEGWGERPPGVERWGHTIGVQIDADGSLWVFHRCWDTSCVGHPDVAPVVRYDLDGHLLDGWGEGEFVWPHGFHIDDDGNFWTTDARARDGKGHTVVKHTPDGRPLLTLGTPGVAGAGHDTFDGPSDVVVAPNGDIFVADGHGNDRVVKFASDGRYLMEWGSEGTAPGQFDEPHCLAFDSQGRLWVGDRLNQRIQLFDTEGRFLAEWPGIMASGIHITDDDIVYVADYQLREGIVIARAADFSEIGFIDGTLAEGVVLDADGNVYAGEVIPRNLKKFEPVRR